MDCNKCPDQNNSDTEVILATTELEGEIKDNKKLNFVDDCLNVNVTVQSEVCRGNKLRDEKPRHTKYECSVPIFSGSFVNQPRARKCHLEFSKNNKRVKTPSSRCPCIEPNSKDLKKSVAKSYLANCTILKTDNVEKKNKKEKRCPLRVAELAVPTKRQLIETWRNKSRVLPGFMVERLKQHVMDQIPIAKIPDAIYCFQTERRVKSKKWRVKKQQPCEALKPSCKMDIKMLCILFAHRVAKILSSRQLKLTLNADLARLSKIVTSDISKMMPKYRGTCHMYDRQYKAFQIDLTNKITFWITGILEDSAFKLLEDDLRAKIETEAPTEKTVEFSKPFFTIAKAIIEQENPINSKDLEEEEGAVLDFIDDVVNNVMNVCDPPQLHIDSDSDSPGSMKSTSGKELEEPTETDNENLKNADEALIGSNKDLSDSEHFWNEISNIIDIITKDSGDDIGNGLGEDTQNDSRDNNENEKNSKSEIKHDINDQLNTGVAVEAGIEHDTNDEKNTGITVEAGIDHDKNTGITEEAGIDHDINDEKNTGITVEAGIEHDKNDQINTGTTVEAGIEHDINENNDDFLSEKGKEQIKNDKNLNQIDESSSKVDKHNEAINDAGETHSNVSERPEVVNDNTKNDSNVSEHFEIITNESDGDKNSKKDTKTDLVTANRPAEETKTSTTEDPEPKKHKQTQTNPQNNKSSIVFAEPNQNLLKEDEKSTADKGDATQRQVDAVVDKLDTLITTNKHDAVSQIKESVETSTTETNVKQVKKKLDEKDSKTFPEKSRDKPVDKSSKQEGSSTGYKTDNGESERVRKGSTVDTSENDKICSVRRQAALSWKVCPKTAPPWVYACDQGRGEPSEDSIPILKKPTKVTENELRIWCKDLDTAFTNLDIWNNWISTTCRESLCILKQKRLACPGLARKCAVNWMRLQRNVYKDALVWNKLYHRTANNFKCLKNKYNNIEIVTAEHCAMCTCVKTNTKYHLNRECRSYNINRKDNNTTCLYNNNRNY